jgi:adenylosuccinate synthase
MLQLFKFRGVHCVVDGQFGSTGKGALCAFLSQRMLDMGAGRTNFEGVIYSGGPNSGHTFYHSGQRIVLKQLPTFAVYASLSHKFIPVYLSAGAIIDRDILKKEAELYPNLPIFVHPNAAIVTDEDRRMEEDGTIAAVAGTRSGTGFALVRKIMRDPKAIAGHSLGLVAHNVSVLTHQLRPERNAYFMEVSQGFSLGINSHFYPKVTSRECTVMQGLADARIPASQLARTYMAVRSFPIRVGNVDGYSSGNWYNDQHETTWEKINVAPEITTVTQRVRRVATFSMTQFYEACRANDPDFVFVSHLDYLDKPRQISLMQDLHATADRMNKNLEFLVGLGPLVTDIKSEDQLYV